MTSAGLCQPGSAIRRASTMLKAVAAPEHFIMPDANEDHVAR